ncbi:MAG: hypothetical protein ABIP64_09010 [Burkholderiales bacterium]
MPLEAKEQEIAMLRGEMELLMAERDGLLKIAGAAAAFVANVDVTALPKGCWDAADLLGESLNEVREDTLRDALAAVEAEVEFDIIDRRKRERYERTATKKPK